MLRSLLLAKEFCLQVGATELWISPTDNWNRICGAGLEDSLFPINAHVRAARPRAAAAA